MHNVHWQGTVNRGDRPTGMHHVSVGDNRPIDRPKEGVGRPTGESASPIWIRTSFLKRSQIQL